MLRKANNIYTFATVCCLLIGSLPAWAHHAFSAEFDAKRQVHLIGVVTRVEWINPHAWIYINVKTPNGQVTEWMIEAGTPNTLFRRGISRNSLKIGTEIMVDGYRAKDGSANANGRDLTLPDGKKLFLGSSGSGAPYDEKPGN
jgi:hypothetical protein